MGGRHFAASLALFGMPNKTEEVFGGEDVRTRAEIQFLDIFSGTPTFAKYGDMASGCIWCHGWLLNGDSAGKIMVPEVEVYSGRELAA